MKKNWTVKVAALMLALTMITACFVGSTFAKYVTKAEGEANARVAKWGILLTMEGDELFKSEYETDDTHGYTGLSVKADNGDKLVAPGTKGEGFKATVKGTPEVATRYTLHIEPGMKDVVLPVGEYTDYTELVKNASGEWGYFNKFNVENIDYAPVKWDLKVSKGNTSMSLTQAAQAYPALAALMGGNQYGFSATNAKAIIQAYATQLQDLILTMVSGAQNAKFVVNSDGSIDLSMDFEPGKEMDFTFELVWAWDFDDNGAGTYDKADTYIGNVAAGVVTDATCNTTIEIKATATATQID